MLKIITILVIIAKLNVSLSTLVGNCNQCLSSNNVACLNETHFATCFLGKLTATVTKCPNKRFCTNDKLICRSAAEGYAPICYHKDYCGECELTKRVVTCLNETTYGYCFGGKTPLESTLRSCPQGYICNYNFREVCLPQATHKASCGTKSTNRRDISIKTIESTTHQTDSSKTTINSIITSPTIPTIETIKETPSTATTKLKASTTTNVLKGEFSTQMKIRDNWTICGEIASTGYFKSDDPTCREYVYCYLLSGQYLGWSYYCDGYFNVATQKCQKEKPPNCDAYEMAVKV